MNATKPVNCFYSTEHENHKPPGYSLERPQRLSSMINYLKDNASNIFRFKAMGKAQDNADLYIRTVHSNEYIDWIKSTSIGRFLDDNSTYLVEGSYRAILGAATAVMAAVTHSKNGHSFAAVRPPGHHATMKEYAGFCLVNNTAIAVRFAQRNSGYKRVMVLDLDAHAGDGTMQIFYDDNTVLFFSIHEDPHFAYPHNGFANQLGHRKGYGYTVNMEMPTGSGDGEYMLVIDKLFGPLVSWYRPDFVIISLGFDTYANDRMSSLRVSPQGYHIIGRKLGRILGNVPSVSILEGGYTDSMGLCADAFFRGIININDRDYSALDISDAVVEEKHTHKTTSENMENLREKLSDIHDTVL